jgi:hypothetical protein
MITGCYKLLILIETIVKPFVFVLGWQVLYRICTNKCVHLWAFVVTSTVAVEYILKRALKRILTFVGMCILDFLYEFVIVSTRIRSDVKILATL